MSTSTSPNLQSKAQSRENFLEYNPYTSRENLGNLGFERDRAGLHPVYPHVLPSCPNCPYQGASPSQQKPGGSLWQGRHPEVAKLWALGQHRRTDH